MFAPGTLAIALAMMITSATCWGSGANIYKGAKNYPFMVFDWNYAFGIFLITLAFTMGSPAHGFINNVHAADTDNIVVVLIGGAIFSLANLLVVAAVDMAGSAVGFPVSIGIALVVGTVFRHIL
jgi:glucose uptake protein